MAVLVIGEMQGGNAAIDQRLMQELGVQDAPAAGVIARFAGPTDKGYRIITIWESEEAFRTFQRERLLPTLERMGIDTTAAASSLIYPLDSYRIVPTAAEQQAGR
jgi:hypothetical protein